ncbi:MAG: DUF402 domain-containing protein [Candidatus Bathyarchaeia archaeon]
MPTEAFRAKVRGIYSTALTKILLDNGFKIVQPSETIKERFKLTAMPEENCQPDLEVSDRLDKQGINIVGRAAAANKFAFILSGLLDDAIVRRQISIFVPSQHEEESDIHRRLSEVSMESLVDIEVFSPDMRVCIDVEFPAPSKRKLDEVRGMVVPTLSGHHYYKACGGKISYMLEMAENLLAKGCPVREVENLFKECIMREYPFRFSKVNIEHVKVDGRILHLGDARIVEFDESKQEIKLLRVFSTPGVYDGLKAPKEPGDRAVTTMKIGDWSFRTSYFSRGGEYKGTYININTPVELYPTKVRYVDLEADICMLPDGSIKKVDFENVDRFVESGFISEKLRRIIYEKAEEIMNSLSVDTEVEAKNFMGKFSRELEITP